MGLAPEGFAVRFLERSGALPRGSRREHDYREYGDADAEHLRLLIDLRRLEMPLEDAARIASWCHSGHCSDATGELPRLIAGRRADIAEWIAGLLALDTRLVGLERHPSHPRHTLAVIGSRVACYEAADAVVGSAEGACSRCSPTPATG